MKQCKTPVAVFLFNRPRTVKALIEKIAAVRPESLFVFADGPRPDRPDDVSLCEEARALVMSGIDWPCTVHKRFSESNLGCNRNIVTGCNSVFSLVDRAIILEDDCIPDISFFKFCDEILDRYRDAGQILHICGYNPLSTWGGDCSSYLFSHQCTRAWGWATWRRAWNLYDDEMLSWKDHRSRGTNCPPWFNRHNSDFFNAFGKMLPPTWDYRLSYAILSNSGVTVVPKRSLVSNIGHAADATHCTTAKDPEPVFEQNFPLIHPASIVIDRSFDDRLRCMLSNRLTSRLKRRFERALRSILTAID